MLFPYLAGWIADAHTITSADGKRVVDYTATLLMFTSMGFIGFIFAFLLKLADARKKEGISIEKVMLH